MRVIPQPEPKSRVQGPGRNFAKPHLPAPLAKDEPGVMGTKVTSTLQAGKEHRHQREGYRRE